MEEYEIEMMVVDVRRRTFSFLCRESKWRKRRSKSKNGRKSKP